MAYRGYGLSRLVAGGGSVIVNADGTVSIIGNTDITGTLTVSSTARITGNTSVGGGAAQNHQGLTALFGVDTATSGSRFFGASYFGDDANGAFFGIAKSRGTAIGTMTYPTSGDLLGTFGFEGANEANSRFDAGAVINANAGSTWTASNRETSVIFKVVGSGGVTPALALTLNSDATVSVANELVVSGTGTSSYAGSVKLTNNSEGNTGAVTQKTFRDSVTLTGATTDTSIAIPSGERLIAVALNVDTAVVNSGDNTWAAAFITGSTTTVASAGTAAAQNTKINILLGDELTTGTTEVRFTPPSGTFSAGVIEIVVWTEALTALANA